MPHPILLEGYTIDEILSLSDEEIETWLLVDDPIIFRVGSAEILGKVEIVDSILVIELAQIDGGGEGVLRIIGTLASKYAHQRNLQYVDWIIHSLDCAQPNPKLNPMLDRAGFVIQDIPDKGKAYYRRMTV